MLAIIIASRLSRVRKEIKAYKSMDTARKSSTPNATNTPLIPIWFCAIYEPNV